MHLPLFLGTFGCKIGAFDKKQKGKEPNAERISVSCCWNNLRVWANKMNTNRPVQAEWISHPLELFQFPFCIYTSLVLRNGKYFFSVLVSFGGVSIAGKTRTEKTTFLLTKTKTHNNLVRIAQTQFVETRADLFCWRWLENHWHCAQRQKCFSLGVLQLFSLV